MKKLLIIGFLLLGMCSQISDKPPLNCYAVTLIINSTSGEIINSEAIFEFVYMPESIEKWLHDEGISVHRDSINKLITIRMVHCIEPDKKGL